MTNVERHQYILQQLAVQANVLVVDLCKALEVSTVTIRKDLKFLEGSGLLFRTHGGATKNNPYIRDRSVMEKEKMQIDEKLAIARQAVTYIHENDSIMIASGTTVQFLAAEIQPKGNLTVVTSSINVSQELMKHAEIDVIQLGGALRKSSCSVIGTNAAQMLADFFCSTLFLGVDGIDLNYGISTTNVGEAKLNRAMMESAHQVIVLADSSKFGRKSFGKIAELEKVDMVITDAGVSEFYKDAFKKQGVKLIIAI
ncbi:DeoR/GlpR transcriptional regulator [Sphingobacteriaceae bacterium WQ 2009]|uniref:DeoR/GlpR transcriptional regulator n=1 Tax=Rhinopithecimicrobium faecis TaxID=2820698 RepID=A0A8T4H925_9SPHI|nr:DeoR/GlpR transcriptional regulator [Sphingobacteriaceae bacterium WQ 2009]